MFSLFVVSLWLSSYAKPGMSMETLLDLGRGIVQKGFRGGMGLRRRRRYWLRERCGFFTDHAGCTDETPRPFRFSSLGIHEAPLPPSRPPPKCDFSHPRQLSPFPERVELPIPDDEILCYYGDGVSSGTDHFTWWVKVSSHEVLNSVNKHFSFHAIVHRRLIIFNWNPWPRRGKEDVFEANH